MMTFPELFDRFAAAMLPPETSDATILRFRQLARAYRLDAHQVARLDSSAEQNVFICTGSAKMVAQASGGREQIVSFHFAGELACLPPLGTHAYSLHALTPCELMAFPAEDFLTLAKSEPAILGKVCDRVKDALGRSQEQAIALGRKTAQERIAGFLIEMAERIGVQQGPGCAMRLPMSRRDIADCLGLTNETVSRQFAELRGLGLVETSGRSMVMLPDLNGLRKLAGYLRAEVRNAA